MDEYNKDDRVNVFPEEKSVPQETKLFSSEESSSDGDALLRKGAINSLETWFKLYWIPLILTFAVIFGIIAGCVLAVAGKSLSLPLLANAGAVLIVLNGLFLAFCVLLSSLSSFVLLYRYWKFLPATEAVTTPAKAVGFLFIPVFNLYWVFIAYGKLGSIIDTISGKRGNTCKTLCYAYSIFFVLSNLIGYLTQISVWIWPQGSKFLSNGTSLTVPTFILYIVMMIALQKAFREYLKGPVSNWKNNPPYSLAPIGISVMAGLFLGIILTLFSLLGMVSAGVDFYRKPPAKEKTFDASKSSHGVVSSHHSGEHHK